MIALSVRRLAPLGALALVGGGGAAIAAAAAHAPGGGVAKPVQARLAAAPGFLVPAPRGARILAAPARPVPAGVAIVPSLRTPVPVCTPERAPASPATAAAPKPPSDAVKNTFGILRRERTDDDALPARALAALKASGLEPVDPAFARLLRADGDARAWVVPVPDVARARYYGCVAGGEAPQEGLAVVSLGGGAAGGGGALRELQRGQAAAALDPCAGAGRNMLGVSGIVPDGVEVVFITAADGTAVRADVRDNRYTFVLPRPARPEARYLVWTGRDGTPHVQPLPVAFGRGRGACAPSLADRPRVTPDVLGATCTAFGVVESAPPAVRILRTPRLRQAIPRAPRSTARPAPAPRRPARVTRVPRPAPGPPVAVVTPAMPVPVSAGCAIEPAAAVAPVATPPMVIVPSRPQPRARRGP